MNIWNMTQNMDRPHSVVDHSKSVEWYLENPYCNVHDRMRSLYELVSNRSSYVDMKLIFMDVEFNRDGSFRFAHIRTRKPNEESVGEYDIWGRDKDIDKLATIIKDADVIFMYGCGNDLRALTDAGLDTKLLRTKLIDIQDQYLSVIHRGYSRLESMSRFYGGPSKYRKRNFSGKEVRKQCISDVLMLIHLVDITLNGDLVKGTLFEDYMQDLEKRETINALASAKGDPIQISTL